MAASSVRVFVSSTFRDLEEHRRAVRSAILRLGMHPIGMEEFGSDPNCPWDEAILRRVEGCHVMVGIYAHRYGSRTPDKRMSITEAEFDHARAHHIPTLCYVVDPDYRDGLEKHRDEAEDDQQALAAFKKRIDEHLRSTFTTPDDLAVKVAADLGRHRPDVAGAVAMTPAHAAHAQPAVPNFVGRGDEVQVILDAIAQGEGASIHGRQGIHGMGGVGKTQLARRVVDELRKQGYDTLLEVNLLGTQDKPMEPRDALAMLHRALDGPNPEREVEYEKLDVATLSKLLHDRLRDRRAVVLLDNAADRMQVEPLLPPPHCPTLITSRTVFAVPGLRSVHLDVLPSDEAENLLRSIAPDVGDHAPAIAKACGHLPLALSVVGSLLLVDETLTPQRLLADLHDERKRLERMRDPEDPELDVAASLSFSHARLPDDLQPRWEDLGVLPTTFTAWTAADLWETDDAEDVQEALSRLVRRSLVDHDATTGRYVLHDLLRDLACSYLNEERRFALDLRRAKHYILAMALADGWFLEGGDKIHQGLFAFDAERANFESAFDWLKNHAGTAVVDASLNDWGTAGIHCASLRLHQRERIVWGGAALEAAKRLENKGSEADHLGNLGNAYYALGDIHKAIAYYEKVLQIYQYVDNKRGEGTSLGNLGNAYRALGNIEKAITYHKQALKISRKTNDKRSEGIHLGNLGLAYHFSGDVQKAITHHKQALKISREIGDRRGEGSDLGNLGLAYHALGDVQKAITHHKQALQIAREIGDKRAEGNQNGNLGLLHRQENNIPGARDALQQALSLFESIEARSLVVQTHINLTSIEQDIGDFDAAWSHIGAALACAESEPEVQRALGCFAETFRTLAAASSWPALRRLEVMRSKNDEGFNAFLDALLAWVAARATGKDPVDKEFSILRDALPEGPRDFLDDCTAVEEDEPLPETPDYA